MARRVSMKGKGADLFFSGDLNPGPATDDSGHAPDREPDVVEVAPVANRVEEAPQQGDALPDGLDASPPPPSAPEATRDRASATARARSSPDDLHHAEPDVIELIRKTVKTPGREVSFVRLTPAEKGRLADVVYTYKRQGVKTSENEINRIAVHYMLHDYFEHGETSVLAQVIAALRA